MEKESKIGMGQLVAMLLTSRIAVTLTYSPTRHQASHGTDFFLSILVHMLLMAILILPVWWFSHRTQGAGTLDYAYILFRRGGAAVTVLYTIACLYVLILGLLRFNHFVSTTLSPDMPRIALCIVIAATAFIAAFFGLQAIARAALLIAALVVLCVVLIAIALIPEMDTACFPPVLYDGFSPVISGALEELPRTAELAILGMLWPYVKGKPVRGLWIWCILLTAISMVIQVTVVGVLGDFGEMVMYPYYTAITAAQANLLQRLDIVATAIWLAALFIKMALFAVLLLSCIQRLLPGGGSHYAATQSTGQFKRLAAVIGCVAVVVPGILLGNISLQEERSTIWLLSGVLLAVFAVALPLILTLADVIRCRRLKRHAGE